MIEARQIIERAILALTPKIDTVFENTAYKPTSGKPYQELYFLPAKPDSIVIDDTIVEQRGFFQITLRYPAGKGVKDALERAEVYAKAFKVGTVLENKVYIIAPTSIDILGTDGDRYSVAVSIYFKFYEE